MPSLIAALSMMQTLLLSALSVAREREQGTSAHFCWPDAIDYYPADYPVLV